MVSAAEKLLQMAKVKLEAVDAELAHADDAFTVELKCRLPEIGEVQIVPFDSEHFSAFREFYDGLHPEWGLSEASKAQFDEHPCDESSLRGIVKRVQGRQDARFVMVTQGHVVGYLLVEEIDCIRAGRKTFWGEERHAMIGIGVSDRFHGKGLAALGMYFLKLVAAVAGVELGLCTGSGNLRAQRFYEKHGFVRMGHKDIFVPHTGRKNTEPWYVLGRNDLLDG